MRLLVPEISDSNGCPWHEEARLGGEPTQPWFLAAARNLGTTYVDAQPGLGSGAKPHFSTHHRARRRRPSQGRPVRKGQWCVLVSLGDSGGRRTWSARLPEVPRGSWLLRSGRQLGLRRVRSSGKLKHRHLTSQEAVKSQGMNIFLNCGLCAGLDDSVCSNGGLDGFTYTFIMSGCLVFNLVIVCAFISAALLGVGLLWMVALYLTRLVKMCKAKRARVPTSPLTPTPAPEPIAPAEAQNAEELRFTPQSSCIVSADCDLSEWHAIRIDE